MVKGYGATGGLIGGKTLQQMDIEREPPAADEVAIDILYCGVCHSDIHQVENDWKNTIYPCVPGHEIIGRVIAIGSDVKKYKEGDIVGVGCMIDSCGVCASCQHNEEQYCLSDTGPTMTYNGYLKPVDKSFNTFGGYSAEIVVKEDFVLRIPDVIDMQRAAPILCAGVTTYSPLKKAEVAGKRVGIIGIGGLGHMGVMIAKALGATVTAITTHSSKQAAALELGADDVLISEDEAAMKARTASVDFLLCTIPDPFDLTPYLSLLDIHGSLVTVGLLGAYTKPLDNNLLAMSGLSVGGSLIGGVAETQEVLNFCAENGIAPEVELVSIHTINEVFDKIRSEEVRFRYVIDMQSLKTS
ncbi:MAG: hydroxyacid dehydrogenase [Citrobacter freundii]|nr:MAG: hydroxyacid dehydrogenase [Citrobacter freundii]